MKNLALIFSILFMGLSATAASPESENNIRRSYDGNAYIFVEGNVEFSVFPDGQFDFVYIGPQKGSNVTITSRNVNISFNSGYNYDAYVQYDDYGAVIQVENVPIYYDEYGRIIQAGNVDIRYNNRRLVRVGGLHVIYNHYGHFSHVSGYINPYNRYYVYRPWHVYYARPLYTHCVVYDRPYRRYYKPVRYSYHEHIVYYKKRDKVAYHNGRRDFYRPGSRVYDKRGRASINKDFNPSRENTMISNNTRVKNSVRNNDSSNNAVRSNTKSNTVTRDVSTSSRGAVKTDRNVGNGSVNANSNDNKKSVLTRTNNNTPVKSSNTRTRSVEQRNTPRTVKSTTSNTSRATTVSQNRNSTVKTQTRNKSQAPTRTTTSRSTSVKKSSAPAPSRTKANTSRGSSSRESNSKGSRGRG